MYEPKHWLIELKNRAPDLKKYTIHIIAESSDHARRVAEELHGPDSLATDPVLDNPK